MQLPERLSWALLIVGLTMLFLATWAMRARAESPACDAAVLTPTGVNPFTIEAEARRVAGAEVRVRVVPGQLGHPNMDQWEQAQLALCPSWRGAGLAPRSTLLLIAVAPDDRRQMGAYYGSALSARLSGRWQEVFRQRLEPAVAAYAGGEPAALTRGLTDTLRDFAVLLAPPAAAAQPVVIAAAPVDYGRVWAWFFLLVSVGTAAGGLALYRYNRVRAREERAAAQAEARRLRAQVVSGLLEVTDSTTLAVLQAQVEAHSGRPDYQTPATAMLSDLRRLAVRAQVEFQKFDSTTGSDPSDQQLTAQVYREFSRQYSSILDRWVNPALRILEKLRARDYTLVTRESQRDGRTIQEPVVARRPAADADELAARLRQQARDRDEREERARQRSGGGDTTIFAPVVINTTTDDAPRHRSPTPAPDYSEPSRDTGGSYSAPVSTPDSGGSYSSSYSSDSGGSYSSSSDSGGSSGGGDGGGGGSSD